MGSIHDSKQASPANVPSNPSNPAGAGSGGTGGKAEACAAEDSEGALDLSARATAALRAYFEKWSGEYRANPGRYPPLIFVIITAIGGFVALVAMYTSAEYGSQETKDYLAILGSHGATMVLVFGAPAGPFSQPRNIVVGNTIAGIVSVGCRKWIGEPTGSPGLAMCISVVLSYLLMHLARALNPPAGGTAALGALGSPAIDRLGWKLIIPAVLYGCVFILCACIFINLIPGYRYPRYWFVEQAWAHAEARKHCASCVKKPASSSSPSMPSPQTLENGNAQPTLDTEVIEDRPLVDEEEYSAMDIAAVSQNPSQPFSEQYQFGVGSSPKIRSQSSMEMSSHGIPPLTGLAHTPRSTPRQHAASSTIEVTNLVDGAQSSGALSLV